jgi:hypothetical protein
VPSWLPDILKVLATLISPIQASSPIL